MKSQTYSSLIERYLGKPYIRLRLRNKSRLKLCIALLDFLQGIDYLVDELEIDSERAEIVVCFMNILGFLRFSKRILAETDYYNKYTLYPTKRGTKLEWYYNFKTVDPKSLLSGANRLPKPEGWGSVLVSAGIYFTFSPELTEYQVRRVHDGDIITDPSPDLIDWLKVKGINL